MEKNDRRAKTPLMSGSNNNEKEDAAMRQFWKRILSLALVPGMLVSLLAGCNGGGDRETTAEDLTSGEEMTDATAPDTAEPENSLTEEMRTAWLEAYGDPIDLTDYSRFRYYGNIGESFYLFYCKNPKASRFGTADRVAYGVSLGTVELFHTQPFQILRYDGGKWKVVDGKNGLLSEKIGEILADYHRECQKALGLPSEPQLHGEDLREEQLQRIGNAYCYELTAMMEWSEDPSRPSWYGTYGSCTVIYQFDRDGYKDQTDDIYSPYPTLRPSIQDYATAYQLEVAGCLFEDATPFMIHAYADGKLYSLEEAYAKGLLSWDALWEISVLHNATNGSLDRSTSRRIVSPDVIGELTEEQAARIVRIWQENGGVGDPPVALDEKGRVVCNQGAVYYGTYGEYVVVFRPVQSPGGYDSSYQRVGNLYFSYHCAFASHVFTQDAVMPLQRAYGQGLISNEDLKTIAKLHDMISLDMYRDDQIIWVS